MHPSSSSSQPPDHPDPKYLPPAMGYPAAANPSPTPTPTPTYIGAPPAAAASTTNGHPASFGVAYPYTYPAPPPHPYHHFPPRPPPPTCLRRLLALCLGVFLVLGAATFVVWLVLRPRVPAFSLTSLSLTNLTAFSPNATLSASFAISLVSSNPNSKLSVSYFSPIAYVSLTPSSPLAVVSLPPFYLAPRNSAPLAFRLPVDGAYVGPDAAAELAKGSGVVEFQVRVAAVAVFERGGWRTRRRVVRVMCDSVPVAFRGKNARAAGFDGPPRQCDVAM